MIFLKLTCIFRFRLAACLLIELGRCDWEGDWDDILAALPPDLFEIYNRFLTRATDTPKRTAFVQAIFRWLVFAARQVSSDELAGAISFNLSDPNFDFSDPAKSIYDPRRHGGNYDIFKLLEGLIVIKESRWDKLSISFTHSSVKDYILSPQFRQQFNSIIDLTKGVSHRFITQTCVRYLLLFADAKHMLTEDTHPNYPISLYAAQYWFHHLHLCDYQDQKGLFPSTMRLMEDGSSQYIALYRLHHVGWYGTHLWDIPVSPAVCVCSQLGYIEGVRCLLIEWNASVNLVDKYGQTALHLALSNGHLNIARLLIERNASVNLVHKYGRTALHLASSKGHLDIARLLIEHNASVDLVNKYDQTALHLASSNCHLDIARLLIECNACVDLVDKDGQTELHLALSKGHLDIARLPIEHNASVDLVNKDGGTALHFVLSKDHLNIARLLIEHNASVDLVNKYGRTALNLVLSKGHLDIARLLIEHNASVDLVDKYGQTVLHLASSNGHLDIARLLIEHNASVDLVEEDRWTALHLALSKGHLNIARLLIEHNASVNLVNKYG
jgi:ankyrin repeat protein